MSNILSYATIEVEVLNDRCWQQCEEFDPYLSEIFYSEDFYCSRSVFSRQFECRNLEKCKRLSAYLERSE